MCFHIVADMFIPNATAGRITLREIPIENVIPNTAAYTCSKAAVFIREKVRSIPKVKGTSTASLH